MSILSAIANTPGLGNAGKALGATSLRVLGSVQPAGATRNAAFNIANNLTNSSVNIAGKSNPGTKAANTPFVFGGQQGQTSLSAPNNYLATGSTRSGSGSSSAGNAALAGVYDAQLGRLGGILDGLGGQQSAQENIINGQYNQSHAGLDTSRNRALTDLQTQQDQIQQNKARSLNDLSARGRNLMQALNNQFGTMGAGSSSASQILAPFGIAQQQNRLGGDINQQSGEQIQAVDTERNRVEQDYKNNLDQLEQARMNNLLQVGQQFQDLAHQIQDQMTNANAQKASALGGAYKQAVSAANAQVAQIEQGYQAKLGSINNYYSNYHPTANTDIDPVSNNVQALNTAGFTNVGVDPSATQQAVTAAYIDPTKDQNQLLY